jgi:hypothetical protein
MKKYFVIYHSTQNIECITIFWWVLVSLFVHLTSRLASTFSCTLYCAFTQEEEDGKTIFIIYFFFFLSLSLDFLEIQAL